MTRGRAAAVGILSLRVVYGLALIAAPGRVARRWLGPASDDSPAQVSLRGLGAREVALHSGALRAALSGAPVRPWLAVSIAGDLADVAATAAARDALPNGSAPATLLVGGGSALLTAVLAAAMER